MKRLFCFSLTFAAAIGFATVTLGQATGGAGASGSAGAGASGSAGAGAAATGAGTGGNAGTVGNAGTTGVVGNNPASGAVNPGIQPGANNGVGVGNNFGANSRGRFNGTAANNNNAAARTGRNNLGSNNVGSDSETAGVNNGNGFNNGGISQTPFFNNPAVRRELNLNDTQFNSLNTAYRNAYNTYNQGVNNLGQNLTPDQRAQEMELLENRFNNSFNSSLDSNLTDTQARLRFDQLNRQYMGLNAFNNSAIQRQLNLTPQQRQQIRSLASQWRDQQGTNGGTPNYSQYSQQLNSILTPQQQQTWSQLTGSQFSFGSTGSTQNGVGAGAAATGPNSSRDGTPNNRGIVPDPSNNLTAPKSGRTVPFNNGEAGTGNTTGTGAGTSSGTATGGTGAGTTNGGTSGSGAGTSSGTSASGTGAATGATGTTGGTGK
jgi:hypothetical protein